MSGNMRGASLVVFFVAVNILILFFYYITLLNSHLFGRSGRSLLNREFYECGFKTIPDIRLNLDLQFSILCFIFLVYDIEIILLVPIIINIHSLPIISYIILWFIIFILLSSYYYEWEKYVLQWGLN